MEDSRPMLNDDEMREAWADAKDGLEAADGGAAGSYFAILYKRGRPLVTTRSLRTAKAWDEWYGEMDDRWNTGE